MKGLFPTPSHHLSVTTEAGLMVPAGAFWASERCRSWAASGNEGSGGPGSERGPQARRRVGGSAGRSGAVPRRRPPHSPPCRLHGHPRPPPRARAPLPTCRHADSARPQPLTPDPVGRQRTLLGGSQLEPSSRLPAARDTAPAPVAPRPLGPARAPPTRASLTDDVAGTDAARRSYCWICG